MNDEFERYQIKRLGRAPGAPGAVIVRRTIAFVGGLSGNAKSVNLYVDRINRRVAVELLEDTMGDRWLYPADSATRWVSASRLIRDIGWSNHQRLNVSQATMNGTDMLVLEARDE